MAGTFSQIYIQAVCAVKDRENLLRKAWRNDVFKYMTGIIKNKHQNLSKGQDQKTDPSILISANCQD